MQEEILDSCKDEPSPADFSYSEVMPFANTTGFTEIEFRTPTVFNQGAEAITNMACTRYGLTHIVNAQNQFVANLTNSPFILLQPKQYWLDYLVINSNAQFEGATLQSALTQFLKEGLITGYAKLATEDEMKSALLNGNLIYTGSKNGDWVSVRNYKVYKLRTDNAVIGHAFCIVGFNNDGWIAINSYGESNGYFIIPYEFTSSLYSRYAVMDSKDKEVITNYKLNIMREITIEDAKLALEAKLWNGERATEPATREEVAAMVYRAILSLQ